MTALPDCGLIHRPGLGLAVRGVTGITPSSAQGCSGMQCWGIQLCAWYMQSMCNSPLSCLLTQIPHYKTLTNLEFFFFNFILCIMIYTDNGRVSWVKHSSTIPSTRVSASLYPCPSDLLPRHTPIFFAVIHFLLKISSQFLLLWGVCYLLTMFLYSPHMWEILLNLPLSFWLPSFSMILSRSVHTAANCTILSYNWVVFHWACA